MYTYAYRSKQLEDVTWMCACGPKRLLTLVAWSATKEYQKNNNFNYLYTYAYRSQQSEDDRDV